MQQQPPADMVIDGVPCICIDDWEQPYLTRLRVILTDCVKFQFRTHGAFTISLYEPMLIEPKGFSMFYTVTWDDGSKSYFGCFEWQTKHSFWVH